MATNTMIDVVMPQMGVSVSEGTIVKWLKDEGQPVQADEALLEISTDKVDTEVPSPGAGVVQRILVQEGETVDVGTKLAEIAPDGAAAAPVGAEPAPAAPATAEAAAEGRRAVERRGPCAGTLRSLSPLRRRLPPRRPSRLLPTSAATARHSSHPSWRASPPSTASTSARSRGPDAAAA